MRRIKKLAAFKRDLKRESKGPNLDTLNQELPGMLASLAQDKPLPIKYRDHALTGDWAGRRECHIKPDLLLVYLKVDGVEFEDTIGELRLVRLGSHSEIFG